jgi:putative drug exporter of the RND superfamily
VGSCGRRLSRALLVAGLPLISALSGVAVGLLGLTALTGVVTLNSRTPTLALMLDLAVGIDYALFIVSRHDQHLDEGMSVEDSIALSVATAGSAVCFAGLTVVIALSGLLVVGIPFLSTMGLGAAGTVVLAVLIANTMLPALLGFAGLRAAKRREPAPEHPLGRAVGPAPHQSSRGRHRRGRRDRYARLVCRRRRHQHRAAASSVRGPEAVVVTPQLNAGDVTGGSREGQSLLLLEL